LVALRAIAGRRPFHTPRTRTRRCFVSHGCGSPHVCKPSLTELNDDAAVRRQIVEDTVSAPLTAAGASRSGSSTAEPERLGRHALIIRTSSEIGVDEGGCAVTRATARCAGARLQAGSKLTGDFLQPQQPRRRREPDFSGGRKPRDPLAAPVDAQHLLSQVVGERVAGAVQRRRGREVVGPRRVDHRDRVRPDGCDHALHAVHDLAAGRSA
jgi:hypothetical protein